MGRPAPPLLLPAWETVQEAAAQGDPITWPTALAPKAFLSVGPGGLPLSLLLASSDDVKVISAGLASISIDEVLVEGVIHVRIFTTERYIYEQFHGFIATVLREMAVPGTPFARALATAIQSWRDLLQPARRLSALAEKGILGELWLLERLIRHDGPRAIASWTGPSGDAHDFRRGDADVEVKTTTTEARAHWISSIDQLLPAFDRPLFLLSLQVKVAPEAGISLPTRVDVIRSLLSGDVDARRRFDQGLAAEGYADGDAALYTDAFLLRSPARLIPVVPESGLPLLSRSMLAAILGAATPRLMDVRYRIEVADLGAQDGEADFLSLIPEG